MSEALPQAEEGRAVTSALGDYPKPTAAPRLPYGFGLAIAALLPASNVYPGRHLGAVRLLDHRTTIGVIRQWAKGAKRAPFWALDRMQQHVDAKIAELAHIRELLEAEKKKAGG